jgi:tetratricopeptide (TPR) repeat protein
MYQKMAAKFNNISFTIITSVCALLPLFFLPVSAGGFGMVKGFIFYIGVLLGVSFWLVAQFIDGVVKVPKSRAFIALGAWVILSLVSALTSTDISVSLWGKGFVLDSFATTLMLSLLIFMVATFAKDQRRLVKLFLVSFSASVLTVFLQVILYVSQNIPFVSKNLSHVANQGTLVGSWVDFTYFVTFTFVLGLLMYEVLSPKGFFKKVSLFAIVLSLICLIFLNFKAAWIIAVASSLLVFVYKSSVERSLLGKFPQLNESEKEDVDEKQSFSTLSFASLLVGLFFFLSSGTIGASISQLAGISFTNIRPSFETTTSVMRQALYKDPLFGSGAGTYGDVWNLYHPTEINQTIFWNTPFQTGYNFLQSFVTTNGILPTLAFVVLIILVFSHGFRLFNYQFPDRFSRFIAVSSLIMTIAVTLLLIFGAPGMVLIASGFVYIGLLFGVSSLVGKTQIISIEYLKDPRMSFFVILSLVIATMGTFSAVYFTGSKFASIIFYNKALASSEIANAEININKAISLSSNDEYWVARTRLYTNEFTKLAQTENPDKTRLQGLFTQAEQSARAAVERNRNSATNWLVLSQVYQLVSVAESENEALKNATSAAEEALKRNPINPAYLLNKAKVALISKNTDAAFSEIEKAIALKKDYLDAYVLRGQIKQSQGNTQALKEELIAYTSIAPNDEQGYVLLGNLYNQSKNYTLALEAFSKAQSINPRNPENYLFYVSTLELSGERSKAIEVLKQFKQLFPNVTGVDDQIKRIEEGKLSTPVENTTENDAVTTKKN